MSIFSATVTEIQRTITLLGRDVILRRQTGTTQVDATKPWLGLSESTEDLTIKCTFEPFKLEYMDGLIVKSGDVKAYIGSESLGTVTPTIGDTIVDGTQSYLIHRARHFKPSDESICWEFHLREC